VIALPLEMYDIQGDLLTGMQKNAELFLFFRITDGRRFKDIAKRHLIGRVTTMRTVNERERRVPHGSALAYRAIPLQLAYYGAEIRGARLYRCGPYGADS
jgi:hypothetical protein